MNDTVRNAFDCINRAELYSVNTYGFNNNTITDLAKHGIDARMRLIEVIAHVRLLISEIDRLKSELEKKGDTE